MSLKKSSSKLFLPPSSSSLLHLSGKRFSISLGNNPLKIEFLQYCVVVGKMVKYWSSSSILNFSFKIGEIVRHWSNRKLSIKIKNVGTERVGGPSTARNVRGVCSNSAAVVGLFHCCLIICYWCVLRFGFKRGWGGVWTSEWLTARNILPARGLVNCAVRVRGGFGFSGEEGDMLWRR